MNRNSIIAVVIVIILVLLGIWYFSSNSVGTVAQDTATTTGQTGTTGGTSGGTTTGSSNTFHSIFTQSGNHECTYEQVGTSTRSTSVVYIADGKMRGEFRTTGSITSADLMIYNGGVLYSWKEGATTGVKTSINSLADLPQAIPQDLSSGAILGVSNNNVSWDCHDWAKDTKLFTLPTYVTFSARS